MFNFLESLCGCFSPELKKQIIDYLSSAKLNRNLIEEEKTNEDEGPPQDSIYSQVKTKSYYFMKLQQDQEQHQKQQANSNSLEINVLEPHYYPTANVSLDELYKNKLACLQQILKAEIGPEYSKVYDSQDDIQLKIYCKPQIYQNKRFNSYRFTFKISNKQHAHLNPRDYLAIDLSADKFNLHQPLLVHAEKQSVTEGGVEIYHRKYKKVLVINQHEFYTAEKSEAVEQSHHTGSQEVVYHTCFSVKGEWSKVSDCSRGWMNLSGLRIAVAKEQEEEGSTSLRQEEDHLQIQGYINCQLDISVNANMLKQPVAKEIRVYVQKLICSLTKSDAI